MLEADPFLHECLNTALNEYVSKQTANNANDALILAGQLKGARGVLEELKTLHKPVKKPERLTETGIDYGANKHTPSPQPRNQPKPGSSTGTIHFPRAPVSPP